MKADMAGAAAVVATMIAVAALKPPVEVTAYLPMAENMLSGAAYRPGDVVTMYGGKRVEVLNTDAEGRMILADAIARACEDGPDYLIETSTLTGGQVVALGKRIAGVMGTTELCERVGRGRRRGRRAGVADAAARRACARAWTPTSPTSGQGQRGMDRAGHMLQGGAVPARVRRRRGVLGAHRHRRPGVQHGRAEGLHPKGGTGVPVRTLVAILEDIAAKG